MKDITQIEKLAYQYNASVIKNADIYVPVQLTYGTDRYHFSSQGSIFNSIFKDNLDYYEELIDGIEGLKRANVAIAMRSDD